MSGTRLQSCTSSLPVCLSAKNDSSLLAQHRSPELSEIILLAELAMEEVDELLQIVDGSLGGSVQVDENALLYKLHASKSILLRPLQTPVRSPAPSWCCHT